MSLPDTVFIFVLALIVFGPKKLPEIGRQIGRLVGEFRRASNEFKFQIEEELRQVERADQKEKDPDRIDPPENAEIASSTVEDSVDNPATVEESDAIGQHPNIDSVNGANLESQRETPNQQFFAESPMPVSLATITAAAGSQARTTLPYAGEEPPSELADISQDSTSNAASNNPAPSEAEITHG